MHTIYVTLDQSRSSPASNEKATVVLLCSAVSVVVRHGMVITRNGHDEAPTAAAHRYVWPVAQKIIRLKHIKSSSLV